MMKKYIALSAVALALGGCLCSADSMLPGQAEAASAEAIPPQPENPVETVNINVSAPKTATPAPAANQNTNAAPQNTVSVETLLQQAQQAYQSGDKASAINAWQAAAGAGNATAQHNLSVVYRTGDGVAPNPQLSMDYLVKAAQQNYTPAVYDMGSYYLKQGNPSQAAPLMQAAAQQGYAPAQFNLGVMLVRGDGVEKNEAAGIALIKQAAAQGFGPAQQALQPSGK